MRASHSPSWRRQQHPLLLLDLTVGSVFLKNIRHGSTSFNHLHICILIHHRSVLAHTNNALELRLPLREPRSLAQCIPPSEGRLLRLATPAELHDGLPDSIRPHERLELEQRGHRLAIR